SNAKSNNRRARRDRREKQALRSLRTLRLTRSGTALREVLEPREFADECELDDAGGPVALFADDQLRHALILSRRVALVVYVFAIDEDDDVGVLFERARFPQVRQLRAVIGARLGSATELRQHDDRDVQLLGEPLERSRNRRELQGAVLETPATLHQL